mmetsp:Transcript_71497/g.197434  ORF Transcript_71497/g.197434 Transcript_71497/m.197434 type:complete len:111 (-) Transcript_71497:160-492(-)
MPEAEVLAGLEPTEAFYETRVGSAERLISWYVLFHAMAEPSSRLPVLGFELGLSESRLRVASTPAPVPVHAGSAGHVPAEEPGEGEPEERDGEPSSAAPAEDGPDAEATG